MRARRRLSQAICEHRVVAALGATAAATGGAAASAPTRAREQAEAAAAAAQKEALLRAELSGKKLSELQARALAEGCEHVQVMAALDAEGAEASPRGALISLICGVVAARGPHPPPGPRERRGVGWGGASYAAPAPEAEVVERPAGDSQSCRRPPGSGAGGVERELVDLPLGALSRRALAAGVAEPLLEAAEAAPDAQAAIIALIVDATTTTTTTTGWRPSADAAASGSSSSGGGGGGGGGGSRLVGVRRQPVTGRVRPHHGGGYSGSRSEVAPPSPLTSSSAAPARVPSSSSSSSSSRPAATHSFFPADKHAMLSCKC
jgi:hypothetical protein